MAASEIMGSRRSWQSGNRHFVEQLLVTADGVSGITRGDAWGGDSTGDSTLAAPLRRRADQMSNDIETVPTCTIHRIVYWNFIGYS